MEKVKGIHPKRWNSGCLEAIFVSC